MRDEGTGTSIILETERLFLREMDRNDYDALYRVLADTEIMRHYPYTFDEVRVRAWIERNRDVSVISKEDCLSEIGVEVINQQKEGLQDGILQHSSAMP